MAAQPYDLSEFNTNDSPAYDLSEFNTNDSKNKTVDSRSTAALTGLAQGIGQIPQGAATFLTRALGGTLLNKNAHPIFDNLPTPINPYDVSSYHGALATDLSQNQRQHPYWGGAGKFAGNILGLAPVGAANAFGTSASGAIPKIAQFIGNLGAQGAASTYLMDPNSSKSQLAAGAAIAPVAQYGGSVVGKTLARGGQAIGASVSDLMAKAKNMYSDVYNTADKAGYKTIPINAANAAQDIIDKANNGSSLGASLSKDTVGIAKKMLDDAYSVADGTAGKNAYSLKDTHNQMRQLDSLISQKFRAGDNYNAGKILDLKKALTSDVEPSVQSTNNPDLANKFFDTQKFYRDEVIPIKNNPMTGKGLAGEIAAAHTLAHLPTPIDVAIGAGLGESGVLDKGSLVNLARRFGSPNWRGGPQSILNSPYNSYGQTASSYLGANSSNILNQLERG